ncbi:MAG: nucleotidyl transferase AbiEii/AbiGii toxin family protein [Acetobacter sp.]|nr:nucleotidyl transferase AbiEii/AbiGii toxin family protein [Acetobacter sp.]
MQTVLEQMLGHYKTNTTEEKKNALKEVVQEVALCGLSRAGFFKHAAFYGGTALRIFYGLDRFSEDLDFSLVAPNADFQLNRYFSGLESEMASLGLRFSIEEKQKTADTAIKSAFLKGNTKEHILSIYDVNTIGINPDEVIKIKFEVDTNPPAFAQFENKYRLLPTPYQVKLYDMPSLFAGKLHAVICRAWKSRVKGRDLYDYVFYLAKLAEVNLPHLRARLEDSGALSKDEPFTRETLLEMLNRRFETIDFEQAKQDVLPFIANPAKLDLWSKDFFIDITKNLQIVEETETFS